MYFIVETLEQFSKLQVTDECFVQIITANNSYHPKLTSASLVYYHNGEKGYILPVKHSEAFSLDLKLIEDFLRKHERVYLLDKKYHSYFLQLDNGIDLYFVQLDQNNEFESLKCDTLLTQQYYAKYEGLSNVNEIIPISKHYETCQCLYDKIKGWFGLESNTEFQDRLVFAYKQVEQSSIGIDYEKLQSKYQIKNAKASIDQTGIYSCYNLYNLTARPTNSFNGINFLAIPKEKEFRQCFAANNDYLVEFDFDGYHLRLIADLIGYQWSKESVHETLGKQYFEVDQLTEEQYKESKSITFKQLYGNVEERYKHIEFFSKLQSYIENLWSNYNKQRGLALPTGRIIKWSKDMNKSKLFNYVVQNQETLVNVDKIERINQYLSENKLATKLLLITYDAFLFDYSLQDGKQTLLDIKQILELGNLLVKHKYSETYAF